MSLPGEKLGNTDALLRHLSEELARHRGCVADNAELERKLRCLDGFQWHIERNLLVQAVKFLDTKGTESSRAVSIPVLLLGPTGVFVLHAARGAWSYEDVAILSNTAQRLDRVFRDYPDPVRAAIVLLDSSFAARHHYTWAGEGPCSVLGDAHLECWLTSRNDHGFTEADIARLRDQPDPSQLKAPRPSLTPRGHG
jgi:hypothetical protein